MLVWPRQRWQRGWASFQEPDGQGMCTTATKDTQCGAGTVKMSLQFIGALTKPACIAGVRVSRPIFNALCGRMKS